MATKVEKRKDRRDNLDGLDDCQKRIVKMREELNKADPHQVKAFTKYKIITYFFNVLFPPYAIYRIWCKKSEFTRIEQIVQTLVAGTILTMFVFLQLERYGFI